MKNKLPAIGRFPLCNGRSERAPHICGYTFILCWRCAGLLSGCLLCHTAILLRFVHYHFVVGIAFVLPCVLDAICSHIKRLESTNVRRFVTGLLAGIGVAFM